MPSSSARPSEAKRRNPLQLSLLLSPLLLLSLATHSAAQPPQPPTVRIRVFSLFHPKTLLLTAEHPVTLLLDGTPRVLDPHHPATLRSTGGGFLVDGTPTRILTVPATVFTLAVPARLTRSYTGALTVTSGHGTLVPVIRMETEVAVASIVAAESPPNAPAEALRAQSIASRSFLLATRHAHAEAESCDTTHCQFLRSPPLPGSPAALATAATRHQVLLWRPTPEAPAEIVAAMYSRACGGSSHALTPVPPASYPFFAVPCSFCLQHPQRWSRPGLAIPPAATEKARLAWNRTHGWSSIPSTTYTASALSVEGRGSGHGIGLCQLGAADLARRGLLAAEILARYYPDTSIATLP